MVQLARHVIRLHPPHGDQQHRTGWQRDQNTDETKQLPKRQQRKNHRDRVQTNALTHKAGRTESGDAGGAKHSIPGGVYRK